MMRDQVERVYLLCGWKTVFHCIGVEVVERLCLHIVPHLTRLHMLINIVSYYLVELYLAKLHEDYHLMTTKQ